MRLEQVAKKLEVKIVVLDNEHPFCHRLIPVFQGSSYPMTLAKTNEQDVTTAAIAALSWVLADDARAQRFLDLTGFAPDDLRLRLMEPGLHDAVRLFLEGHPPDLVACAQALGVQPEILLPPAREHWA